MNNEKPNDPETGTGLIDRRYFLKKSSSAVAVIAAGSLIATSAADNLIPAENDIQKVPAATGINNTSNKHWQAGWMAF